MHYYQIKWSWFSLNERHLLCFDLTRSLISLPRNINEKIQLQTGSAVLVNIFLCLWGLDFTDFLALDASTQTGREICSCDCFLMCSSYKTSSVVSDCMLPVTLEKLCDKTTEAEKIEPEEPLFHNVLHSSCICQSFLWWCLASCQESTGPSVFTLIENGWRREWRPQ